MTCNGITTVQIIISAVWDAIVQITISVVPVKDKALRNKWLLNLTDDNSNYKDCWVGYLLA